MKDSGRYKFIGEAFILGIMHGELFDGLAENDRKVGEIVLE